MAGLKRIEKLEAQGNVVKLLKIFLKGDAEKSRAATEALTRIGQSDYNSIIMGISNPNEGIRQAAVKILVRLNNNDIFDTLVDLLEHNEPGIRLVAAEALGFYGDINAADALGDLLNDNNELVAATAEKAIVRLGGDPSIYRDANNLYNFFKQRNDILNNR